MAEFSVSDTGDPLILTCLLVVLIIVPLVTKIGVPFGLHALFASLISIIFIFCIFI